MTRRLLPIITMVALGWSPIPSYAESLPSRFTLGRYIPDDVWIYLHGVHDPQRNWLEAQWDEVFDAWKDTGIGSDLTSLALDILHEQDQDSAKETVKKWTDLLAAVPWRKLASQEFAYAQRVATTPGRYDYFVLVHGDVGSGKANCQALVRVLKEFAQLRHDLQLSAESVHGVDTWSLWSVEKTADKLSLTLNLLRKDDIIALTTGMKGRNEVLALLSDPTKGASIARSPRFRKALEQVAEPKDFVSFVDAKRIFRDLTTVLVRAGDAKGDGLDKRSSGTMAAAVLKAMERCDIMDYVVKSVETKGRRELHHEASVLQPSKAKCNVACCGLDRKPFRQFEKYIPADATSFSMSGSINLEAVYHVIAKFMEDEVPNGPQYLSKFNGMLASIGFDLDRDLFSWWSGEIIQVSLPAEVVTPLGATQDSVLMVRVKDGKIAAEKIESFFDFAMRLLQTQGQTLVLNDVKVRGDDFKQVVHPFLAMAMKPVVGVSGSWLIVGTSAAAVDKCLQVSSGDAPSVLKNERFAKEGLIPKGPVMAASFSDTSNFGDELSRAIGLAGVVGSMASGMLQGDEAARAKELLTRTIPILTKLGPVARTLDFYSSESSITTYDGKHTIRTERVVNYKADTDAERQVKADR